MELDHLGVGGNDKSKWSKSYTDRPRSVKFLFPQLPPLSKFLSKFLSQHWLLGRKPQLKIRLCPTSQVDIVSHDEMWWVIAVSNPFTYLLRGRLADQEQSSTAYRYFITNALGQMVDQGQERLQVNGEALRLNLSALPAGVFYLNIYQGESFRAFPMVKQ